MTIESAIRLAIAVVLTLLGFIVLFKRVRIYAVITKNQRSLFGRWTDQLNNLSSPNSLLFVVGGLWFLALVNGAVVVFSSGTD